MTDAPRAARMRRSPLLGLVVLLTVAYAPSASAGAAPRRLDPTFGRDGSVITRFRDSYAVAVDVAVQGDGRLVVVGPVHGNGSIVSDIGVVRYLADGQRDPTFSRNGKRGVDLGGRYDQPTAVALQPDRRIVVVGSSGGASTVVRLLADGSLDDSFSRDGHRSFDPAALAVASDVALQPDGAIVLAGSDGPDVALVRILPGGVLDDSFGTGGVVHTDVAGFGDSATSVTIDGDGRIVVGGWSTVSSDRRTDFLVARYLSDGRLDPSFGVEGIVTTDFRSWEDMVTEVAVDASGAIVVAGQASDEPGSADQASDVGIARYLPNGVPDPSFGDGGTTTTDLGSYFDQAHGLTLPADGTILVSSHRYVDGARTAAMLHYDAGGDLDPSFGSSGILDTGLPVSGDEVGGVVTQSGGRIVAATAASVPAEIGSTFRFLMFTI